MRVAPGTSKGELLVLHDSVMWDGYQFPCAEGELDLPEAHCRRQGLLPHLHDNLAEIFPRIHCEIDSACSDLATNDSLELKGYELGKATRNYA